MIWTRNQLIASPTLYRYPLRHSATFCATATGQSTGWETVQFLLNSETDELEFYIVSQKSSHLLTVCNFIYNQYGERLAILNTENIKMCGWITKLKATKNAICSRFLPHLQKIWSLISQGSVATCLRRGGQCHMSFVANFIRFPAVQKFWKSVKIWRSYGQLKCGNFFETQCI